MGESKRDGREGREKYYVREGTEEVDLADGVGDEGQRQGKRQGEGDEGERAGEGDGDGDEHDCEEERHHEHD